MKRVLNGVHVLMAIGLVVALAACAGSDGSIKAERDDAQAAAAAAEKMAMDAAAAQAAAEKMAMDAAAAQAAAEKMAMDDAAALAVAEKMAMDAAAAQAAAEKMAMDAAAAQAAAEKMAMDDAAAATAAAEAAKIAADEALALAVAETIAAEAALAQALLDKEALEPSAEELAEQKDDARIKGAQDAFGVLAKVGSPATTDPVAPAVNRRATSTLKVSHDGMAVKFSASGPDATDPVWTKAATNMALPIPDWASDTLTGKPAKGQTGTGMVYSNIEEATYKLFAVQHEGIEASLAVADAWKDAVIAPGNEYTGGADGGSIPGSFQGADGFFRCSVGSCADIPTRKSDGKLSSVARTAIAEAGGTWIFEPTAEDAMVKLQDPDYLMFGYWLSKDKDTTVPQAVSSVVRRGRRQVGCWRNG